MTTAVATQDQASTMHEVDLGIDSGVVASALIPLSLWQSSSVAIASYASGKGLSIYDYVVTVGQSLTGMSQNMTTLAQVQVWIDNVAQQEGTSANATSPLSASPAGGISETTIVVGACAVLAAGLGLLLWWRS